MANLDGENSGVSQNGDNQTDAATDHAAATPADQAPAGDVQPFLMAQADNAAPQAQVAAINPTQSPGTGDYVPTDPTVTADDIRIDGRDLLVTHGDGSVERIVDAYDQFDEFIIGDTRYDILWPENIGPARTTTGSGGDLTVDPGAIDPALPITPLLGPTELSFSNPTFEEIFLLENDTVPDIVRVSNTLVDEDGLQWANPDNNPLLPTETDGNENLQDSGTILIDFHEDVPANLMDAIQFDDLASYDSQLTSEGQTVVFALVGGDLVGTIDGGSTEVLRISFTGVNDLGNGLVEYTYTTTLSHEVDHPQNNNEDTLTLSGIQFTVTDSDGSTASGTVDAAILDDVPQAYDDGNHVTLDNIPVTVDVISNDTPSADTPLTLTGASVEGGAAVGTASINSATGEVTFTASNTFAGTATVNYTATDADGDQTTASFTVTVRDSTPETEARGTSVDEDGLGDANADTPTALEGDHGGSATNTGTIWVDFSNDVPANLNNAITFNDLPAYDSELTSGGATVTFLVETATGDLVGSIPNGTATTEVIRIHVEDNPNDEGSGAYSYTYTVTLSEAVDQPGNDNEDSVVLDNVTFTVTDSDGSTVTGTFDVTIWDDVPTAVDDGSTSTADTDPVTVDVLANDISGADNPITLIGASVAGGTATGDASINTATGEVTFTAAAGFSGTATVSYTIEDADGDKSTASFTVDVSDSTPSLEDTNTSVDEDGLGDANADVPTLLEADHGGNAVDTGTITVDFGNDVPGDLNAAIVLDDLAAYDLELTSGGVTVTFLVETATGDLVGSIPNGTATTEVIRIHIEDDPTDNGGGSYTYDYTVTLSEAVDQPINDNEDSIVLNGVQYTVTDSDGSTNSGTVDVTIWDDVPTAVDDGSTSTNDVTPVTVDVLANDISGADNPITLVDATVAGGTATGDASINTATGEVTFTAAAGFSGQATVTYTIEDADGDQSTASFTVNVGDTSPQLEDTNTSVDEDGLGDANTDTPTALEGDHGGNAVDTGTITVDFGSDVPGDLDAAIVLNDLAAYDLELTSGGATVTFLLETATGDLVGSIPNGTATTEVIRIHIEDSPSANGGGSYTYDYTVTLSEAVDQPSNNSEDSIVLNGISYTVTDSDGSHATGTVDVTIWDDVPTAVDDGSTSTADTNSVTVDVLSNDISGADDPITIVGASVAGGTATGDVSFNTATGEVTFTATAGFSGTATVSYTIEDADGDKSTASFTVDVSDSTPSLEDTNTSVDEDGLGDANADTPTLLEADHGGNAVDTGTITVDFGNDVPGDLDAAIVLDDLAAYDLELTSGGATVTFLVETATGDLVGSIPNGTGTTEVIRVHIEDSPSANGGGSYTYDYTVTLSEAVDQPSNNSEDSIVLNGIQYTVTDSDGSTNSGTVDVTIYDDVPTAVDDGSTSTADTNPVTVDVLSNDISGADNPITIVGASVAGGTATGDVSFNTATGEVTFTATAGFSGTATVSYTIEDADGDQSTASFTVDVSDSTPSVSETDTSVDEDGLGTANTDTPLSTESDFGNNAVDTGTITVDFGNDVPGDLDAAIVLDDLAAYDLELTSGGVTVSFALDSGDLVGTIPNGTGTTEIIRIHVEDTPSSNGGGSYTYDYTVTLSGPVDQPLNDQEDSIVLNGIQYTVTDSDGSTNSGSFDVTVYDDVPNLLDGYTLTITNQMPSTASTTLLFNEGADGLGSVVFVGTDNTELFDTNGNQIMANGDPVLVTGYGTSTLTGYIDEDSSGTFNAGDTQVMTVELDPVTDSWTAMIAVDLENGTATTFDLLSGISGGNNDIQAVGATSTTNNDNNVDLILDGNPGSVNTSNGRIGIGNGQSFTDGEAVKIEFVVNATATADVLDGTGFNWDSTFGTTVYHQDVNRITGGNTPIANFTVTAWSTDGDDTIYGDPSDTIVDITAAKIYDDNGVLIYDGTDSSTTIAPPAGVTVTYNVDGSISFTGIQQDWSYTVYSDNGDPFTGVSIEGDTGTNTFTLGALTLGEATTGDPFDLNFDILGSDNDGDKITDTITLHVEQPSASLLATIQSLSLDSTSGGSLDGGGSGGGGTGGGGGGFGGHGGTGPTGFYADFHGIGDNLMTNLLGQSGSSFKDSAFVLDGTQQLNHSDLLLGHQLAYSSLGQNVNLLAHSDAGSAFGADTGSGSFETANLTLSDMVDHHSADLSSLVGSGHEMGGLNALPADSMESGLSGMTLGLQMMDHLTYDHA